MTLSRKLLSVGGCACTVTLLVTIITQHLLHTSRFLFSIAAAAPDTFDKLPPH